MELELDVAQTFNKKNLAKYIDGFEFRQPQLDMALEVETALKENKNLLIEAPTGVGKSLAYLIPAAIYSIQNKALVVISTETRTLQNQLLQKEIPVVSKLLNINVQAEVAFGSSNYLCKRRLSQVITQGTFGSEMNSHLTPFYEWEKNTQSGIRFEYKGFASEDFWRKVGRDPDTCFGRKCPNFSRSYYFLEKEKWKKANLLLVNHYLLATHLANDSGLLPNFEYAIIDEAHNFSEIIGRSYSMETSYEQILSLLNQLSLGEKKSGLVSKLDATDQKEKLIQSVFDCKTGLVKYFNAMLSEVSLTFGQKRLTSKLKLDHKAILQNLEHLLNILGKIKSQYTKDKEAMSEEDQEISMSLDSYTKQLDIAYSVISYSYIGTDSDYIVWLDPPSTNEKFPSIHIHPANTESIIRDNFLEEMKSVTFTSATLCTGNEDFSFFKKNLGTPKTLDKTLDSPFSYEDNSLLYLPRNIHDPTLESDAYHDDLLKLLPMLFEITSGACFVLFTSNKSLNMVYKELYKKVDYPCISQLSQNPEAAFREFMETEKSILFGVSTFWQGVDIRGDKLKSVIITKLPFQPPNEPVLESKIEELKKKGGNPFFEIQVPRAILTLKQGFGRLIRSKTDTGIVSLLDSRVHTKNYGKLVIDSLPPAKRVYTFKDLKREYENLPIMNVR